jgi:hypothetical protein
MAQHRVVGAVPLNIIDKRRAAAGSTTVGLSTFPATPANYASISALDTRLAAISGTKYTQARLDTMTLNDKVYALRLEDDSATV